MCLLHFSAHQRLNQLKVFERPGELYTFQTHDMLVLKTYLHHPLESSSVRHASCAQCSTSVPNHSDHCTYLKTHRPPAHHEWCFAARGSPGSCLVQRQSKYPTPQ